MEAYTSLESLLLTFANVIPRYIVIFYLCYINSFPSTIWQCKIKRGAFARQAFDANCTHMLPDNGRILPHYPALADCQSYVVGLRINFLM